jgi:hypothetical protein
MQRFSLAALVALSLALVVGPAVAQQPAPTAPPPATVVQPMPAQPEDCPKLIDRINRETNIRFDPAAANAKVTAAQATKMQADKKYTECVTAAQAALTSLGVKN